MRGKVAVVTKLIITHSWAARVAVRRALVAVLGGGFPKGSVSMRARSGVIECLTARGVRSGYQTSTVVSVWKRAKMQEGQKTSPRGILYLQEVKKKKAVSVHPNRMFFAVMLRKVA